MTIIDTVLLAVKKLQTKASPAIPKPAARLLLLGASFLARVSITRVNADKPPC